MDTLHRNNALPRSPSSEDPWDIGSPEPSENRGGKSHSGGRVALLIALLLGLVVTLPGMISAQSAPPPTEELKGERRRQKILLDRRAERVATEYLDLAEQAQDLTRDYYLYFSEFSAEQAEAYQAAVEEMTRRLRDTAAYSDLDALVEQFASWEEQFALYEKELEQYRQEYREEEYAHQEQLKDEIRYAEEELADLASDRKELKKELRQAADRDDEEQIIRELEAIEAAQDRIEMEIDILRRSIAEEGYRQSDRTPNPRLYRLARSFRRELQIVSEMLEEDIADRLDRSSDQLADEVTLYVQLALADRVDEPLPPRQPSLHVAPSLDEGLLVVPPVEPEEEGTFVFADDSGGFTIVSLPETEATIDIDLVGERFIFKKKADRTSSLREWSDTLVISDRERSILVHSSRGDVEVVGWNKNRLVATYALEVSAQDANGAKALLTQSNLSTYERGDKAYVEAAAPRLTDSRQNVDRSHLKVFAPRNNPIVIGGGFGHITVGGFDGAVKLKSEHAMVTVQDCRGEFELLAVHGAVDLSDLSGKLFVSSSHGDCKLTDATGSIEIKSDRSGVHVIDCEGDITISNNANVTVSGFKGPVELHNSAGMVELSDIVGDVTAVNSNQPVFLREIDGAARVENSRGLVMVEGVRGKLAVTNNYAPIMVQSLSGPVSLRNNQGSIEMLLDDNLVGPSRVVSQGSSINVRLAAELDLLLTVESVGGSIVSSLPLRVNQEGDRQTARMALGNADQSLAISGTGASVVIVPSR